MAKAVDDKVLDAALNVIGGSNQMSLCEGQPLNRTEAITAKGSGGKMLAIVSMSGGDYTNANGDTSGRKVTVAAKSGLSVGDTGTGDHVALVDATDLNYVTTAAAQAVTAGGTVNIDSWKAEIEDPA
jgi:hypothetical protein